MVAVGRGPAKEGFSGAALWGGWILSGRKNKRRLCIHLKTFLDSFHPKGAVHPNTTAGKMLSWLELQPNARPRAAEATKQAGAILGKAPKTFLNRAKGVFLSNKRRLLVYPLSGKQPGKSFVRGLPLLGVTVRRRGSSLGVRRGLQAISSACSHESHSILCWLCSLPKAYRSGAEEELRR